MDCFIENKNGAIRGSKRLVGINAPPESHAHIAWRMHGCSRGWTNSQGKRHCIGWKRLNLSVKWICWLDWLRESFCGWTADDLLISIQDFVPASEKQRFKYSRRGASPRTLLNPLSCNSLQLQIGIDNFLVRFFPRLQENYRARNRTGRFWLPKQCCACPQG